MSPIKCRSCDLNAEDGRLRCRACQKKFRRWLDGGPVYTPMWNGVVDGPPDEPVSALDRALAKKRTEE